MGQKAPALENGLAIIELVAKKDGIGFNQIKSDLGFNPASLNRYINTLLEKGYIQKDDNKQYVLGDKMHDLLSNLSPPDDILEIVQPIIENISAELGCTVQYMSFENGRIVCKTKYVHSAGLSMQNVGESRTDYILHPWGFLYLMSLDEKKRKIVIQNSNVSEVMKKNIPNDNLMHHLLTEASNEGYSDDEGRIYNGIRRIAAPVYKDKKLIGAIGIGLIGTSLDETRRDSIVRALSKKTKELSEII